mmetsp:Transcript_39738/g.71484  ORF Transcript_39738/g.71484 Transcript_39738/m.71484 type:complete len:277 (-) Transcript_39738:41-871(-)|eukprot:CAMPEP_0197692618 /NCGR_PEP_ID=MMETSP1338-20131121/111363_1 /TAXON_ID=43686 ORGANISM="Pelagodinium beii, Strain RCC1491" /NCGR_SAMPLE_ID=MMETSP1338 /ASSEMBLY_ACC=CAM_ASM_000754 /LENGTH=276 /DNA_ID=CAMNT_0043275291 /DNA_START=81 /DNA_END=911 /DNA_ORIENTATION=+
MQARLLRRGGTVADSPLNASRQKRADKKLQEYDLNAKLELATRAYVPPLGGGNSHNNNHNHNHNSGSTFSPATLNCGSGGDDFDIKTHRALQLRHRIFPQPDSGLEFQTTSRSSYRKVHFTRGGRALGKGVSMDSSYRGSCASLDSQPAPWHNSSRHSLLPSSSQTNTPTNLNSASPSSVTRAAAKKKGTGSRAIRALIAPGSFSSFASLGDDTTTPPSSLVTNGRSVSPERASMPEDDEFDLGDNDLQLYGSKRGGGFSKYMDACVRHQNHSLRV